MMKTVVTFSRVIYWTVRSKMYVDSELSIHISFFVKIDLVENVKRVSNNRIFLDSFWNFLKFLAIVLALKYTSEIFLLKKLQNYISIGSF